MTLKKKRSNTKKRVFVVPPALSCRYRHDIRRKRLDFYPQYASNPFPCLLARSAIGGASWRLATDSLPQPSFFMVTNRTPCR